MVSLPQRAVCNSCTMSGIAGKPNVSMETCLPRSARLCGDRLWPNNSHQFGHWGTQHLPLPNPSLSVHSLASKFGNRIERKSDGSSAPQEQGVVYWVAFPNGAVHPCMMQTFDLGGANSSPGVGTTPTHPFASFGKRAVLLVWVLSFLALGLRLYRLSDQAFWLDEIYSVLTAKSSWNQIYAHSTQVSNSLPTYFLILRAILPESNTDIEWVARLPSALAGALSVPVFIGLVYCWRRNTRVALLAGLLLAVNPLHIWYSQEARAYALMLFFGLLAMLFLELALFSRRSEWLTLYLFSVFPAVALHRSALIFPALCVVWHMLSLSRETKPAIKSFKHLLIHLPIGIGVLLLMFVKLNPPPEGYRRAGSILQFGYTFMTFLGGYSFGPSLSEIQNNGPLAAATRSWLQIVLLLAALALIVVICKLNWRKLISTKEVALLADLWICFQHSLRSPVLVRISGSGRDLYLEPARPAADRPANYGRSIGHRALGRRAMVLQLALSQTGCPGGSEMARGQQE
jgi:hypothetical protein